MHGTAFGVFREIDLLRREHARKLLERDDEIHVAPNGRAGSLQFFGSARPDKDHAGLRGFLFYLARRRDHGRQSLRDLSDQLRELFLGEHRPRGTAGGKKEREFSGYHLFYIVMCFRRRAHVRAAGDLVYLFEADIFQGALNLRERDVFPELSDNGRARPPPRYNPLS